MAKFKTLFIDIYKRDITIFIGTHSEFKEWVAQYKVPSSWEQLIESIIESNDDALASYWYNNSNGNGIIELPWHPKSPEEIATAAHEALHCVSHVLSYVGIPHIPHAANEAYNYLLEYILKHILYYSDYTLINI